MVEMQQTRGAPLCACKPPVTASGTGAQERNCRYVGHPGAHPLARHIDQSDRSLNSCPVPLPVAPVRHPWMARTPPSRPCPTPLDGSQLSATSAASATIGGPSSRPDLPPRRGPRALVSARSPRRSPPGAALSACAMRSLPCTCIGRYRQLAPSSTRTRDRPLSRTVSSRSVYSEGGMTPVKRWKVEGGSLQRMELVTEGGSLHGRVPTTPSASDPPSSIRSR